MLGLNKKEDKEDEENRLGLSEGFLNIMRNTGAIKNDNNNFSNGNNSSKMYEINPHTGLSNGFTNILLNTTGINKINDEINRANKTINTINRIDEEKKKREVIQTNNTNFEQAKANEEEQINKDANRKFRINSMKSKEEIDKQVKQAKSQNITMNNTNNNKNNMSMIRKSTNKDKDTKIGLANQYETQYAQTLSQTEIQAMKQAEKKNENIKKGGIDAFNETANTLLSNIYGGAKERVGGLVNIATSALALGIRGLEGASKIVGLEELGNNLNSAYNSIVDAGRNIEEKANYESTVNSLVENEGVRTIGQVANVISGMATSSAIAYVVPASISGSAVQGLSVAGGSAQEVLNDNKDNITQATLTGIAKGYTSYFTEKMFDANILTRGKNPTSIQKGVDKLISKKLNSKAGKEIANKLVGIAGENIEELVEDNAGYLIDKLINNKDLPDFKSWWDNTSDTVKTTTLSTFIMSLIGLGGESFHDKELDQEADFWINEAQKIIEQENLSIQFNTKDTKSTRDMDTFYVTKFTQEGEVETITPTKGKLIDNPNKKIDVIPVIVKDNYSSYYNVIDGNTGIVLDSTPYTSSLEAQNGFNDRMEHISDLRAKDINNQIGKASYAINNEIIKNATEAKNELSQMRNAQTLRENRKTYSQEQFNNISENISKISDRAIYDNTSANEVFESISDNVKNIKYVQTEKDNYIYGVNNNNEITYQKKLNKPVYTGKQIKNIYNEAVRYSDVAVDDDSINTSQNAQVQNRSNLHSNEANYAVQDIKKVTEPFDVNGSYSKNEMAEIWNNEISSKNYDAYYNNDGDIERYIAIEEEGNNIVVNQYDSNDNIVKSAVIPAENGRYSAKAIKNTIDKVASLQNENKTNKKQNTIKDNEVKDIKKTQKSKAKQFDEIITNAINDKKSKGSITLAKVNKKAADRIKKITGIDTLHRGEKISASNIRHILKQHGDQKVETSKGQLAITKTDLKKIPDVIENFDRIEKGTINKDKNGEHQTVRFVKTYSNNTLYVVEVIPNKSKTLTIKTMWKKPIGLSYGSNTLRHTSETKTNVR